MSRPSFLDEMLRLTAANLPSAIALDVAGEPPISYQALLESVEAIAARIRSSGLRPGQAVLVVSGSRARVPVLLHAVLSAGGVIVSIEPSTPPVQLRALAKRARAAFALGDAELLADLAPRRTEPLDTRKPDGLQLAVLDDEDPLRAPFASPASAPGDRLACVIFTSGSTGIPKGVLLSHENLLAAARRMAQVRSHTPDDRHLAYLSFAHYAELFMSVVLPSVAGYTVAFPQGRRLTEAVAAARPTYFMGVPSEWQTLAAAGSSLGDDPAKVRAGLGLDRVRLALSTGAPLSLETHEAMQRLGLSVHEMYGMTETTGASTYNPPGASRAGSVGMALEGSRVEVDETGEILLFGAAFRCQGYLDDPEGTASLFIGEDGVRTGDLGRLEDGYLYVTGRRKDLLVLSTGKKVHPASIEARLASIPHVRHAVILGEGEARLVALLDAVSDPRLRVAPMSREALIAHLRTHVQRLNEELAKHERISAVGITPQPFSLQSAELTPSLKVRREVIKDRHRLLIEAMQQRTEIPPERGEVLRFDDR